MGYRQKNYPTKDEFNEYELKFTIQQLFSSLNEKILYHKQVEQNVLMVRTLFMK